MAADAARLKAYGEHLSRECTACHRLDGTDNGIPSIVAWDSDQFVTTMKFYQQGLRDNMAMMSVAKSLDEEQLRALAALLCLTAAACQEEIDPYCKGRVTSTLRQANFSFGYIQRSWSAEPGEFVIDSRTRSRDPPVRVLAGLRVHSSMQQACPAAAVSMPEPAGCPRQR